MELVDHGVRNHPIEHRADELGGLRRRKRLDVDAHQVLLFPQRRHRVGNFFTRANGRDHLCGAARGDLMNQQRRQPIKQMGVVDNHEQIFLVCQRAVRGRQQHCRLVGFLHGHPALESSQGDRARGFRAEYEPFLQPT